jgi:hypothetical protein
MLPVTAFVPAAIAREPMSDKSGWLYSEPEALTANSKPWSKAMRRHQFNDNTILEERLVDLARRVRADVETLPPCGKRDDLVERLREVETAVDMNRFLQLPGLNGE